MPDYSADDSKAIMDRIAELRRERQERAHVFALSDGVCSLCRVGKGSFAASMPCPGSPDP